MSTRIPARIGLALAVLAALGAGFPEAPQSDVDDGAAAREFFARLQSLEGRWQASSTKGWHEVTVFEVIARGSVVMSSTEFAGEPRRKLVTMFYLDGDRLVLTHYCEARNQPHLVADEIDVDTGRAVFEFAGGGNLPDRNRGHMDRAVYEIVDDDTLRSRWTWYEEGQERWLEEIEITRLQ